MIVYYDGGFFFWGGKNSSTVQRLVNITGGENFMYAHVWWSITPSGRVHRDPSPFFTFLRSDGHKKPLTDIIHSKLVYNVPTCSVSSSRPRRGGRSRPKRKSATGHVAT